MYYRIFWTKTAHSANIVDPNKWSKINDAYRHMESFAGWTGYMKTEQRNINETTQLA